MNLKDFDFDLPEELIAQFPLEKRDNSRMLITNKSWDIKDDVFYNIVNYLKKNDVLVINETRTINARLFWEIDIFPKWKKQTKNIEILLHKQISSNTWECLWYPWKNLKIWRNIRFYDNSWNIILNWFIEKISEMWRFIKFDKSNYEFLKTIEQIWELPLPPYIKQKLKNKESYQTIYWNIPWSVRTSTAWLHFTNEILDSLQKKWVIIEKVLLHIWVWTFKQVETDDITKHKMHSEYTEIKKEVAIRLNNYKKNWQKIIAVWTTVVRTLESFANNNWTISYWTKETDIFIYPWYKFKFVDSIITNFHLPKSTLIMLVSAFLWLENTKKIYNHAIKNKYRFFSFWDCMWIID